MASPRLSVSVDARKLSRAIGKLRTSVTKASLDPAISKVSDDTLRYARRKTPKRLTGKTREAWKKRRRGHASYYVENNTKVYKFIDNGTKAHGPKRARVMVLLLSKRALKAGVKGVLANRRRFRYGKDYAIARRVRGIKPMRITEKVRAYAQPLVTKAMDRHIRKALQ